MPRKRYSTEQIVTKLRQAEVGYCQVEADGRS